jgi:hypothetical protein
MWVLDQVFVQILNRIRKRTDNPAGQADDIFFLFFGTHSQIPLSAPDEHQPSEKIFERSQALPLVFLNFAWDASYSFPPSRSLDASNMFAISLNTVGRCGDPTLAASTK